MRKSLLLFLSTFLISIPLFSQNPDVIYVGTWATMSDLGTAITPDTDDPVLTYNEATGCYEGEVIDWAKCLGTSAWNARIPYSITDGEVTYYSAATSTNITFSSSDTFEASFNTGNNPADFKGYVIATAYTENVVDVKISMNLETATIIFTKFKSDQSEEIPVLVNVEPENGTEITPDDEGGVTITLTFSGPVTRLTAGSESSNLQPQSNDDGTVWTIYLSESAIKSSTSESQGTLNLRIENVYAGNLPVDMDGKGNNFIILSYTVAGITNSATILFEGDSNGLATLDVYKYPEYTNDAVLDLDGWDFSFTYSSSVTYLFTVGEDYEIEIVSTVDPEDGENWSLGEAYSLKVVENTGTSYKTENDVLGTTLTIKKGSNGATFTVTVNEKNAGVKGIASDNAPLKVYSITGNHVLTTTNKEQLKNLKPGIYIVNGEKIILK